MTEEEFIEKARQVHGDKYDYSKAGYVNTTKKVRIICPEHGEFTQTARNHLKGSKCPICAGNTRRSTEEFIEKARKVHGDRYDYSKTKYVNSKINVIVTCREHGDFRTTPYNHIKGQGCPYCAGKIPRKRVSFTEFVRRAREVHGDKFKYYGETYDTVNSKMKMKCPLHGEFWQTPYQHLVTHGCPCCTSRFRCYGK